MSPSNALPDPWPLLARVNRCRVQVFRPADPAGLVLRHEGEGVVEVTATDSEVTWQERGRWTSGELAGLAFHNAVRWRRRAADAIEVSHLRRGASQPTFLVELRPEAGGWRAAAPHLCGPDSYDARLAWTGDHLTLEWQVTSPTDPYTLRWTAPLG